MRKCVVAVTLSLCVLVLPTVVFAQASITGYGQGRLGRGASGGDRRGDEPFAD